MSAQFTCELVSQVKLLQHPLSVVTDDMLLTTRLLNIIAVPHEVYAEFTCELVSQVKLL